MRFNDIVNAQETNRANTRVPLLRRAIPVAMAAGLATTVALSIPRGVSADDDRRGHVCSIATLRGEYGVLVSGVQGIGPGRTESFV